MRTYMCVCVWSQRAAMESAERRSYAPLIPLRYSYRAERLHLLISSLVRYRGKWTRLLPCHSTTITIPLSCCILYDRPHPQAQLKQAHYTRIRLAHAGFPLHCLFPFKKAYCAQRSRYHSLVFGCFRCTSWSPQPSTFRRPVSRTPLHFYFIGFFDLRQSDL